MNQSEQAADSTLKIEYREDVAVVGIEGSLTEEAPLDRFRFRSTMQTALISGHLNFVLDLSRLEKMDAYGLGELVAILTTLCRKGGILAVARPSQGFYRFFDSLPLMGPYHVYPSVDEAIEAILQGTASFLPDVY